METKDYYTPSIEELFIGYECEYKNADKWQGIIIAGIDEKEGVIQSTQDSYYWQPSSIRTPYLCKQAIEEQGWVFNTLGKDDWFKGQIHKDTPYDELHYPFELWFKLDKYWLGFYKAIHKIAIIEKGDFQGGQTITFAGVCKSKNELKKLMKDYLNIETK